MIELILPALIAAAASFFGAGLAARLALSRFYREKLWERKVAAYGAIFNGLHHMKRWFSEHFDANIRSRELAEDTEKKLSESYDIAKAELLRCLDSEVWLLPPHCQSRLRSFFKELQKPDESWFEHVDNGLHATGTAIRDLHEIVQRDLGLQPPWYARLWQYLLNLTKRAS